MPVQILTLKLDGVTAGDYLAWCQDPEPPALDFALRSISIDADPLGDTISAVLDWTETPPPASTAAAAAGLPLPAGVRIDRLLTDRFQETSTGRDGLDLDLIHRFLSEKSHRARGRPLARRRAA